MLISVIVPVYNCEKYLKECIDSIINQTYKNLEIILVDDGSIDSSAKICEEYSKHDARIKFFSKENEGSSIARNFGLKRSLGDVISFVDSDDLIEKNMYEYMINVMKEDCSDIVACETIVFYNNHKSVKVKMEKGVYSSNQILKKFLVGDITVSSSDKIYKRKCFKDLDIFPENKIAEDHKAVYELVKNSNKISLIDKSFYNYRQDNFESITKKPLTDKIIDVFTIKEGIINDIKESQEKSLFRYLDTYMIPTAIYTQARVSLNSNGISKENLDIIKNYFDKYKFKCFFDRYVKSDIKIISLLVMLGLYKPIKVLKGYFISYRKV